MVYNLWLGGTGTGAGGPSDPGRGKNPMVKDQGVVRGKDLATTTSARAVWEKIRAQSVPNPNSDIRDPRAAPARDLFLVRDSIRQLASDDQGVPNQATKDVCDPIEATRSIPARVPFVSTSRLNSFGGPIQQSSKVKR
ncbi:hypothetical protein DY000_02061818 [Brassica cretica]|uniref:Uncharacterized protein n=1 Tax=Brassica cretica TaxID=69181 RepID=A0ABQ7AVU7_BRACR|nr:hypothetical protein DY000_02061818 [Brassica cretica]